MEGGKSVDFSSLNHHDAFSKLIEVVTTLLEQAVFTTIRQACIFYVTSPDVLQYPSEGTFVLKIASSKDFDELVMVLSCFGYFNWFDTRLLKVIVNATDISEAKKTLEKYNEHTAKMKLSETFANFPAVDLYPSSKYTTVVKKFDKKMADLTVGDIRRFQYHLGKLVKTADIKVPKIKTGCVEIMWLVPKDHISQAYNSVLANHHQFDALIYLKFGNYPAIFSPRYVLSAAIFKGEIIKSSCF